MAWQYRLITGHATKTPLIHFEVEVARTQATSANSTVEPTLTRSQMKNGRSITEVDYHFERESDEEWNRPRVDIWTSRRRTFLAIYPSETELEASLKEARA